MATTIPVTTTEQQNIDASNQSAPVSTTVDRVTAISSSDAGTSDTAGTLSVVEVTGKRPIKQLPLDNPLHEYDSYTYCLSLHLMNIGDFNDMVNNPNSPYIPRNVLVSSAGKYSTSFQRSPAFTEDFYFENFKMTSIINTTKRNRNSNLIESTFTLIEPNGFTFLDRLLDAADQVNGENGNYMKMPYVLQIDFFGYKDGAIANISNMTKIIPIQLIELKSRITHKGAEYTIRAVPYNHMAFNETILTSKADFSIKARTVADVFGTGKVTVDSNMVAVTNTLVDIQRQESELKKLADQNPEARADLLAQASSLASVRQAVGSGTFNVSGFTDAINSWWDELKRRGEIFESCDISVVFDDAIGNSLIHPKSDNSPITITQAASSSNSNQDQKTNLQNSAGMDKGKVDFNAVSMTVPAGTPIDKLIDWAVRNSEYISQQLTDPAAANTVDPASVTASQLKLNQPLNWYRIVPKVTIKPTYDPSTNSYAVSIVYNVKPWTLSAKHPLGPLGKAFGWSKEYNYMFTGQNKDILDMQIDFNMLYYVQMTSNRNKGKTSDTAPVKGDPELRGEVDNTPNTQTDVQSSGPVVIPPGRLQKMSTVYGSNDVRSQHRKGSNQAAAVTSGDMKESFMLDSRGDMINLRMKIIGDPHFIKQDDIFYNQSIVSGLGQLTPNNSLWTDNGELYVFVTFQSPIDYDESTGLAVPALSKYKNSVWTGIYKIIKIDSEFQKGKFEQTLELARLPYTDADFSAGTNAQQRFDSLSIITVGQENRFAATRFTGPSILTSQLNNAALPGYAAGGLAAGGASASSILQGVANQVVGQVVNQVKQQATSYLKDATKSITDPIKAEITSIADDIKASYYEFKGGQDIMDQLPTVDEVPSLSDAQLSDMVGDVPDIPDFEVPTDLGDFFG